MFGALIPLLGELIKLFPNAEQRNSAMEALRNLELEVAKGQMAINQTEAASSNLFVSGWRPCVGWICVAGFFYTVVQPLFHLPAADLNTLLGILGGMLGLGTMRTVEKVAGVSK